jgi:ketosteroid isomerase-like protein
MTEELHRQRVLNFLDVYYSGDLEDALARCTDDVEFIVNAPIDILPHLAHRQGKAEIREMWRTIRIRYSEQRCEVPILVAQGDKVAALIRVFFRKRTNERMVQFDIAAFYTFRDGAHRADPRNHRHLRSGPAGAGARRRRGSDRQAAGRDVMFTRHLFLYAA